MRRLYEGPLPLDERTIQQVPKLYAEVFRRYPWEEASSCPVCKGFSGTDPSECAACKTRGCKGSYSQEAYPEAPTLAYIKKELAKPDAQGIVQVRMEDVRQTIEDVFAFGWSFTSDGKKLATEKYNTEEMRALLTDLLVKSGLFSYVSEVGVRPDTQARGIGTSITSRLVDAGKKRLGTVVLRTNEDSPMRKIAEKLGMKPLIGLETGLKDIENEARVIFVGGTYGKRE